VKTRTATKTVIETTLNEVDLDNMLAEKFGLSEWPDTETPRQYGLWSQEKGSE